MGVHNSNMPDLCVRGGTIPVTTERLPYRVPAFAVAPLRAGKVVLRNPNNQEALRKKGSENT